MNSRAPLSYALIVMLLPPGCASITGASTQTIAVETLDRSGAAVTGATCVLTNSKGQWSVTSPGSVTVTRSNDNMLVTCQQEGHDEGVAALVSRTQGAMFGNIIFGGGIGAIVDHTSGSAYDYPSMVQVQMGATRILEPPKQATSAEASH